MTLITLADITSFAMYLTRILHLFSTMDRSALSIQLVLLLILLSLYSCVPEAGDPEPDNYIMHGPKDLYPSFSPDGEYIAYFHDAWDTPDPPGYSTGLYIINKDGTNRQLVLEGHHWSPSWSPDGEWLVFSTVGLIQKCERNGESLTRFDGLDNLEYAEYYFPDWSPDGQIIIFDKPLNPEWGFYSISSNFLTSNQLFDGLVQGRNPELSSDNNILVFEGGGEDVEVSEIFTANVASNTQTQLTANKRDNRGATWSPDGKKIAWSSSIRLYIMNADGSDQKEITFGNEPSWSLNDEIVFSHANGDYSKEVLYVISVDGVSKRQVTF